VEALGWVDGPLRALAPEQIRWFRLAAERPDYESFLRGLASQFPRGNLSEEDWRRRTVAQSTCRGT
jgi:hypothetical protein